MKTVIFQFIRNYYTEGMRITYLLLKYKAYSIAVRREKRIIGTSDFPIQESNLY